MAENPNWRKGNLWYWNKQLLQYFFESRQPDDVPVTCLVVTAEELARATGDDSRVPSEVLRAFMDTLRHELGRERRSLCADALDTDWRPTLYYEIPPFVSHLIATCVAASDSSEELIDEGSFLNRLTFYVAPMWRLTTQLAFHNYGRTFRCGSEMRGVTIIHIVNSTSESGFIPTESVIQSIWRPHRRDQSRLMTCSLRMG